eukprot:4982339-Pyramimonas_sp.AAC.1
MCIRDRLLFPWSEPAFNAMFKEALRLAEAEAWLEVALSPGQLGCFASRRQVAGLASASRSSWS